MVFISKENHKPVEAKLKLVPSHLANGNISSLIKSQWQLATFIKEIIKIKFIFKMEHYHPYLNTRLIINKKELFNEDSQYVRYYTTHPACQGPANTPIIQRENKTKQNSGSENLSYLLKIKVISG